jgi:hypothetical protein
MCVPTKISVNTVPSSIYLLLLVFPFIFAYSSFSFRSLRLSNPNSYVLKRQAVEMSIDLATFAWTMLQFQTLPSLAGRPPPLRWNNNLSFNTVLNKYFPGGEHSEAYDIKVNEVTRLLTPPHQPNFAGTLEKRPEPYSDRRFSDLFTFLDMDRLSGFRITPTDNLCDHLRIEKHSGRSFDIRLYVFYQANFLEMLRYAVEAPSLPAWNCINNTTDTQHFPAHTF